MEQLCEICELFDDCKAPCKGVNDILWHDNRVMERHYDNRIEVYTENSRTKQFSSIPAHWEEHFSEEDVIPWSSEELVLLKSKVFVERFFNRVPAKDLAEKYNVDPSTIAGMYAEAVETLKKHIEALDRRREGLKAVTHDRFNIDQKIFLLVNCFGFSAAEVARMMNQGEKAVQARLKRMTDKYQARFVDLRVLPVEDPPMGAKLTPAHIVEVVDAYAAQGMKKTDAFKRIEERQRAQYGGKVSWRSVEDRYYRAKKVVQ